MTRQVAEAFWSVCSEYRREQD